MRRKRGGDTKRERGRGDTKRGKGEGGYYEGRREKRYNNHLPRCKVRDNSASPLASDPYPTRLPSALDLWLCLISLRFVVVVH